MIVYYITSFQIYTNTTDTINRFFIFLKERLEYETFHELFPIILTDNGVEFSKPDEIEFNGFHVYKTKKLYCDPDHPEQKGKIENNHEYIRRFIPKGISFNNYNQENIDLMMNHINSVKRDSLNGSNPYELIKIFLPDETIDMFDIEEINQKNNILNKKLFKK